MTPQFARVWIAGFLQELSYSLMVHFPGHLSELGATESRIGLVYAAASVVALALRPVIGKVLDHTRRRTVLLVVGVLNAGSLMMLTMFETLGGALVAVYVIHRFLQIVMFTAMLTYEADSLPERHRTKGLALFGLAGLIPIATGGALGDVVIGRVGFDGLFVAAAAAQLVSWALVWALPPLPDGARGVEPRRNFWAALAQRDLLPMWFMAILFGAGLETIFTFTRTMVDERRVGTVGLFFGVYGAVAIAGRVAASSRFDRAPQRALLVSSIAAIGAGIVLAGSATRLSTFMVAAALSGLGHGLSYPILSSQIVSRARAAERGSAIAIFTSIFDVALFTVTPLVGLTIDLSGYPAAFGGVGIAVVAGALVYAWWDRSLRPSPSPITPPSVPEAV